jgi:Zn-dependent protease with chaperone function
MGLPQSRVEEMLDLVSLTPQKASRRVRATPWMRQRLGIATALIGEPKVLIFDELAYGVDPHSFRVWIHEGPEATAPATVGSTIALSNWSLYTLPQRNLEAILAHELAHHLPLPRKVSLFLYWLSLPARLLGVFLAAGLRSKVFKTVFRVVIGFFAVGVFVLWFVKGFDYYIVPMLSPMAAPLVVPWLARKGEQHADRTAADLGYGKPLAEVFAKREFDRARSNSNWRPDASACGLPSRSRLPVCGCWTSTSSGLPRALTSHSESTRRREARRWRSALGVSAS